MNKPTKFKQDWYAVYTLPRLENNVFLKAEELGYESFLPTRTVIRQWSDRKKKVQEPLFPNYVFIKTSLQERFELFSINGIVRFVNFEGQPAVIPEQCIEGIRLLVSNGDDIKCSTYRANIGDKVLIQNGQFAGLEGIISKTNGRSRLIVQVKALKQMVSVNIASQDISEPVLI